MRKSRVVACCLAYRKAIVAVGDPFALMADPRLADIWTSLTASPGEVLNDKFSDAMTAELETWLTRYRQRAI